MSTGQKVWSWAAVVISVIVLIVAAGSIIGTWVVRGIAIDVNNGLMDGVIRVAGIGDEAANRAGTRIGEISSGVGEIESAVDEVAQNVSDQGLILTLLPPEKEQNLINKAEQIGDTVRTITSSIEAALALYQSVNSIPFVDLPQPATETVQTVESGVEDLRADIDSLATSVQEFRDGAAGEVSRISSAAGQVRARLQTSEGNLADLELELTDLQTRAEAFKGRFSTLVTIISIVITLVLLWVVYGMVIVIRKYLNDLNI
ncbi:MAG: hypothetical protein R3293_12985 [Candidatus Promineifilaceae bacterium]|nr:hypothetical protein [Candidatus Promineifilaceae bacterium]